VLELRARLTPGVIATLDVVAEVAIVPGRSPRGLGSLESAGLLFFLEDEDREKPSKTDKDVLLESLVLTEEIDDPIF